jgi:hypothetical protein
MAAELIVNGSFEDPQSGGAYQYHPGGSTAIQGWTTIHTGVEKFAPEVVFMGSEARDGDYVLDLNTDMGVGGGIEQTVRTNPGQTYELFFSIGTFLSRGRTGTGSFDVVINGQVYPQTFVSLTDTIQWDDRSIVFVATSTFTTISFQNFDLPNTTFSLLDAVSLIGMPFVNPDQDEDGVIDVEDECPSSTLTGTVFIGDCDTGVPNALSASGCTISDQFAACGVGARNHGQYVSCVAHVTNALKKAGLITGQQKGAIQSCAARSNIGKK